MVGRSTFPFGALGLFSGAKTRECITTFRDSHPNLVMSQQVVNLVVTWRSPENGIMDESMYFLLKIGIFPAMLEGSHILLSHFGRRNEQKLLNLMIFPANIKSGWLAAC